MPQLFAEDFEGAPSNGATMIGTGEIGTANISLEDANGLKFSSNGDGYGGGYCLDYQYPSNTSLTHFVREPPYAVTDDLPATTMEVKFKIDQDFALESSTNVALPNGFVALLRAWGFIRAYAGLKSDNTLALYSYGTGSGATTAQSASSTPLATNTWHRVRLITREVEKDLTLEIFEGSNINGVYADQTLTLDNQIYTGGGIMNNTGPMVGTIECGGIFSDINDLPTPQTGNRFDYGRILVDDLNFWDEAFISDPPPVPAKDESLSGRGWPPLIFTDIRREYWTGNYGAYRELGEPGAATTYINSVEAVDIYPPNDFYTHHVCRLPNGFQDKEYRNGLAFGLTHQYQYSATELQDVSYAYIHRKEEDPSGYERNWVRLDETAVGGPYGPLAYAGGWSQVILAPQRMGPYVYGIGLYMDSFTDDEIFSLWRFKDASTVETLEYIYTDGGASTVERSAFLKVFEGVSNYPAMELYGNCEMFVSDERPARIFFLGGRKATWWDDDSKHGLYVTSYGNDPTASGPAWLNRQTFAAQAADELPNPSLVFPWASGDYGAPQVWFYKKVKKAGKNTGQIAIYRSKFDGSEWDEDWDSSANKVGVFGPLDGLQLEGNGDQQHDPLVIKVARDPRSKNHLRMVVAAGNEFDDSPAYENYATRSNPPMMWTLDSYDDGLTWLRSRKFPVAKRGVYGGPIGNYDGSLSSLNGKRTCNLGFAVSGKGEVICGVTGGTPTGKTDPDSEYPWNSIWKYRATLVYPDYTGKGKGDQTSAKTDHRRSHHRESWVQ